MREGADIQHRAGYLFRVVRQQERNCIGDITRLITAAARRRHLWQRTLVRHDLDHARSGLRPGYHDIDPNSVGQMVVRKRRTQGENTPLAGPVSQQPCFAPAGTRANIDDRPAAGIPHMRNGRLTKQELSF